MDSFLPRPSTEADMAAITAIYAHYVRMTPTTFEIDPPNEAEMARRRMDVVLRGLPHLVLEREGAVVGYAYAAPYRPRLAYQYTVEDSICFHPDYVGKGLGRILLPAVIAACESAGCRQMVAVIAREGAGNGASIRLHELFGFQQVGVLRSVGFKFGRWVDTVLMQRPLGTGDLDLPATEELPAP